MGFRRSMFYTERTKTEKQKYSLTLINSRLTELLPWRESALIKKETSLLTKSPKEAATGIKIIILDAITKKQIDETLVDVKFSGIAWLGDEGFYYSSYDRPDGSVLSAKTDTHKIYFHKLGTKQSEDQLIHRWREL